MRAKRRNRRTQAGFTLIEMLVVVLIIGVVMSFVSLSLNPSGPADRMDTDARRLDALARTAADDAILYGREIGLDITRNGYRFLRLGDDGWQVINVPDSPLRARELSEGVVLSLVERDENAPRLAAGSDDEDAVRPEAFFLSSGEAVPFALEISARGVDHFFRLTGEANGTLAMERIESAR